MSCATRSSSTSSGLSLLGSSISSLLLQYLATMCLLRPYFFPICVKLSFTPSYQYVFSSPMMFHLNRTPSDGRQLEASMVTLVRLTKQRCSERRFCIATTGEMCWCGWQFYSSGITGWIACLSYSYAWMLMVVLPVMAISFLCDWLAVEFSSVRYALVARLALLTANSALHSLQ